MAWDESWWDLHRGLVFMTFRRVKNWHDAEDLVSEAYINVLQFEGEVNDVEKLLRWNLNNRVKDWYKSGKIQYEITEDPYMLEQRPEVAIPSEWVDYVLSLPPYLANVVSGRVIHGATEREVADTLGISRHQVRRQTKVGIEHLRAMVAINQKP